MSTAQDLHQPSSDVDVGLEVQAYHPERIPEILTLTQATLGNKGAVQKSEGFWRWKHEENPFGRSCGYCMWAEGTQQVVGLRVFLRWQLHTTAGETLQAVRAVDTATHPDYQRRGIFARLNRLSVEALTAEGVALVFNTPNAKSLPGYLKLGWRIVTRWPIYLKPLHPARMVARRLGLWPAPPVDQRNAYFPPQVLSWDEFGSRYGEQAAALAAHWEAQRVCVGLRTPRTWPYLQWRYGQHPHITYGVYPLEQAGRLTAFAVLRPNVRYGWQELVLTELFWKDEMDGPLLWHHMKTHLQGDYLAASFAPGTLEHALIRRSGFFTLPRQGMIFTVRPLSLSSPSLMTPSAWDLSLGDLELF